MKREDDVPLVKQENFGDDRLLQKFSQLWFACYFERRLTKQRVEEADLQVIVRDLINYFADEAVDFKRAIPLLQGLHVLFSRKMLYLLKDSEAMLSQMRNPVAELIKVEDGDENKQSPEKSKVKRRTETRFAGKNEGFKINPKHFDWFMAGIDTDRLRKIMVEGIDREEEAKVKLENSYVQVRDNPADDELHGIN